MGYRYSEERQGPAQSRFIDLVSGSAQRYADMKSRAASKEADLIAQGGMAYGQGIGQGLAGLGQGIGKGFEMGAQQKRWAEEHEQRKAESKAQQDYQRDALAQQSFNQMDATRLAEENQALQRDIFGQQKTEAGWARDDIVKQREAEKRKAGAIASLQKAYTLSDMAPDQLMKSAGGPIMPQSEIQRVTDELAQKGYTPEQINQYQLEAFAQNQQRQQMSEIARQQLPGYIQAKPVFERSNVDLNAIQQLQELQKTYEDLGWYHGQEEEQIGHDVINKYKMIMTGLQQENVAAGIDSTYPSQTKRSYMKETVNRAVTDRINSIKQQILALPADARRQPEIRDLESKIAMMEQQKGRPSFTGTPRSPAAPPAVNPYVTASQHQRSPAFQQVNSKAHPFE